MKVLENDAEWQFVTLGDQASCSKLILVGRLSIKSVDIHDGRG